MTAQEKKKYENAEVKAIGVKCLCNFGGIEILDENCEEVVACFNWGNGRENINTHKIIYCGNGRAYFRKMGHRYYFDEIERVV